MRAAWIFPLSLLLVSSTPAHAKRILFAAQYEPVPESQALRSFGNARDTALNPRSIKVMVWNIKKGEEPGLDRDLPAYGKDRDLFVISEGYLTPPVKSIFTSIPDIHWDMGTSFLVKKHNRAETGTMVGSRVLRTGVKVRHTRDREPFINTPKALTIAKFPIQGVAQELLVISVHGINVVTQAAFERHMRMAYDEIIQHQGPVIFAGDFNSNLPSKVKFLKRMISNLGMQSLEFRNDQRMKVLGQTIDYIFVRGLHPLDSEVLGQLKSSDHKAMLTELALD